MNKIFKDKFSEEPVEIIDEVFYYGSDKEGDQFGEEEVKSWFSDGSFKKIFENGRTTYKEEFEKIAKKVVELNLPYLEIACGPGLGITPFIKNLNQSLPALITDGCPYIVKYWNKYIKENRCEINASFASFDNANMPLKDDSIDVITSFLGIGSTRTNGNDEMNCLNELYRVLKKDGYVFAIENELEDFAFVDSIFKEANMFNWYHDPKVIGTLKERALKAGFTKLKSYKIGRYVASKDDSLIAELALKQGKEFAWITSVFIFKK